MNFTQELKNYVDASYSALYISTHEESRVCNDIFKSLSLTHTIMEWDSLLGLREKMDEFNMGKPIGDSQDPVSLFTIIANSCRNSERPLIFVLKDFHLQFDNPLKKLQIIRAFKNASDLLKAVNSCVLVIAPLVKIPIELNKAFQLLDFSLPTTEAINEQLSFIHESANAGKEEANKLELQNTIREAAVEAAKGMTDVEIENAFSLAFVTNKGFNLPFVKSVFREKIQQVKKSGLLTYIETDITFDNVGGLEGVKDWARTRKHAFSVRAREYKLPFPKGIGLAGIAGCGKTLISKAIANELGFPLFQLDLGKLFSKYVGETEQNFADMIKTVESIGRCVLQIDEVEKYLNTGAVSGQGDSGTSSRSFGSILTWMSDRKSPAFIIATSNNHLILPMELIRKGRFDEWFWVDLPSQEDKEDIFNVVIKKFGRRIENFDTVALSKAADKFSGAEIDNVFKDAMFNAFAENEEVQQHHVIDEIKRVTPQAVINETQIAAMRDKVEGRLRLATNVNEIETNYAVKTRKLNS